MPPAVRWRGDSVLSQEKLAVWRLEISKWNLKFQILNLKSIFQPEADPPLAENDLILK